MKKLFLSGLVALTLLFGGVSLTNYNQVEAVAVADAGNNNVVTPNGNIRIICC